MTEEIYKSEEFYKNLFKASKIAVNQYFRHSFNKEALVDAGIDYVLNKIETIDLTGEQDHDFELLKRKCSTGMKIYINNQRTIFYEDISDKDAHIKMLKNYTQDNLAYENLKELLITFLGGYDFESRKIIILNIRLKNMTETARDLKMSLPKVTKIINSFRQEFANFLLECGFLENLDVLIDLKSQKIIEACKRCNLRKRGLLSFESYLNDFKIYKLLRQERDLKKFAECIDKPVDYLDKIINHKVKKLNLTYYEIQKLRQNFYPNFSFLDLVEAS